MTGFEQPAAPGRARAELRRAMSALRAAVDKNALDDLMAELVLGAVEQVGSRLLAPGGGDVDGYQRAVQLMRSSLEQLERVAERQPAPWSEPWWPGRLADLRATIAGDRAVGAEHWLRLFADGLFGGHLAGCRRLLAEFPADPLDPALRAVLVPGLAALEQGAGLAALPMLAHLGELEGMDGDSLLGTGRRAVQQVMVARALLDGTGDLALARQHLERARHLVPDAGHPLAALGDCLLYEVGLLAAAADGDRPGKHRKRRARLLAEAQELYQRAAAPRPGEPAEPEGLVGLGRVAELEQQPLEAEEHYTRAADAFGRGLEVRGVADVVGRRLGRPTGLLLLVVARRLAKANPEGALDALERGLRLLEERDGAYPRRPGYQLQAEILTRLNRPELSAAAAFEAGRRASWAGEYAAASDLLRQAARDLPAERRLEARWTLVNNLVGESAQPEPPFVAPEPLAEALGVWESTTERPAPENSWAYLSRSVLSERRGRSGLDPLPAMLWEAVLYGERAVALAPREAQNWVFLSGYYDALGLQAAAIEAARKALEIDGHDLENVKTLVVALVNRGDLAPGQAGLDRVRKLLAKGSASDFDQAWEQAVQGYIWSRQASPEEGPDEGSEDLRRAVERLTASIEAMGRAQLPVEHWQRIERAVCLRLLDEPLAAAQDLKAVWARSRPDEAASQKSFAWAAYNLGKPEEALAILRRMPPELPDLGDVDRAAGLSLLVQGELEEGEQRLARGIAKATARPHLVDLRRLELPDLRRSAPHRSNAGLVEQALDRLEALAEERFAQVARPPGAAAELRSVLAASKAGDPTGDLARVAAKAALVRLRIEAGSLDRLAPLLRDLRAAAERFPEVEVLASGAIQALVARGDRRLAAGDLDRSLADFAKALDLLGPEPAKPELAKPELAEPELGIRARLIRHGPPSAVGEQVARALATLAARGAADPAADLAGALRPLIGDVAQYWALDERLAAVDGGEPVRAALRGYLEEQLALAADDGGGTDRRVVVTIPWATVPADPQDRGDSWPLFLTYVPAMRDRLLADLGVVAPNLHFRGGDPHPDNHYSVAINGRPLITRQVPLEARYVPQPAAELVARGLPAEAVRPAADPVTGAAAAWVQTIEDDAGPAAVVLNGVESFEPLHYIVLDLEATLRRQAYRFFGSAELTAALEQQGRSEPGAARLARVVPDQAAVLRLRQVCRQALRAGLPITPIEAVLDTIASLGRPDYDIEQAVAALRIRLAEGGEP